MQDPQSGDSQSSRDGLNRRTFLRGLGLGGGALLLAACQTPSAPAPPAVPPTSAPVAKPTPAAAATTAAAPKPAEKPTAAWDQLVEAAKKEGKVVVSGPPSPAARAEVPAVFKERFGIEVEYLGGRTGDLMTKLEAERGSGVYTLDAQIAGAQSLFTIGYPQKMYDSIKPILIHPEVVDTSKWIGGKHWFAEPEEQTIIRMSNYVSMQLVVNTSAVKPDELKSWKDLLDPKYRGKISVWDPTVSGTGWNTASYLLRSLGEDFVKGFYVTQQAAVTRDNRQAIDWTARATYPISLALGAEDIKSMEADNFPIAVIEAFPEAPGYVTAGFGLVTLMNQAPHPNAAKLFVNWILTREGQEIWHRTNNTVSNRNDVPPTWAPAYVIPKPGVEYFDSNGYDYTVKAFTPENLEQVKKLTTAA